MTGYVLLDTDVFSYLWKGDQRVEPYRHAIEGARMCISFATVAEIYKGAEKNRWGTAKIERLETHLQGTLVVPYDVELARTCGRLLARREGEGRRMEEVRRVGCRDSAAPRHPAGHEQPTGFRRYSRPRAG